MKMVISIYGKNNNSLSNIVLVLSAFLILISPLVSSAQSIHPICQLTDSDSDGDGWGWENGVSCIVDFQSKGSQINYCVDPSSDEDGDGWGWENNLSCVVEGKTADSPLHPICSSTKTDSDGDGWGWENGASCVVGINDPADTNDPSEINDSANISDHVDINDPAGINDTADNNDPTDTNNIPADINDPADIPGDINAKLPAEITDLILVTGQSNTLGANTTVNAKLDSPHPRVLAFTNEGWKIAELHQVWDRGAHPGTGDRDATDLIHNNFALHFGKRLVELDDNAVVGIILVSEPGMGIRNWAPGAPGMARVQQKVIAAINELPHKSALDGILWHQGETDWQLTGTSDVLAAQPAADDYYPVRFASLLENFRLENWFDRNTPFICGETIKAFGVNTHLNALNADNDANTACVEGEGLPSVRLGGNHFNAQALRTLGQRYAERYNLIR